MHFRKETAGFKTLPLEKNYPSWKESISLRTKNGGNENASKTPIWNSLGDIFSHCSRLDYTDMNRGTRCNLAGVARHEVTSFPIAAVWIMLTWTGEQGVISLGWPAMRSPNEITPFSLKSQPSRKGVAGRKMSPHGCQKSAKPEGGGGEKDVT